jgi:hypothetical protein
MKNTQKNMSSTALFAYTLIEKTFESVTGYSRKRDAIAPKLVVVLLLIGFIYLIYYILLGYGGNPVISLAYQIEDTWGFKFFPINAASPLFAFNFFILFFLIYITVLALILVPLTMLYIRVLVYKKLYYKHAMFLMGDNFSEWLGYERIEEFQFEINPIYKLFVKIVSYIGLIEIGARKILRLKIPKALIIFELLFLIERKLIKSELININDIHLLLINAIETDIENRAKSRYYIALLTLYFKDIDVAAEDFIRKNLFFGLIEKIEKAEFQFGMFLINKTPHNSMVDEESDTLDGHGLNFLRITLNNINEQNDIKNLCRVELIKNLAESDESSDLKAALKLLQEMVLSDKKTIRKVGDEYFARDSCKFCLSGSDRTVHLENLKSISGVYLEKKPWQYSRKELEDFKMSRTKLTHISLREWREKITLKLEYSTEKESYLAVESEKRQTTENLMAMFAHKFRGPVDSIIFNTQHKNDERIYLDAARTMTGLLEVFSIVSTAPETLIDSMKSDVGGDGSPEKTILRSMKLALMQLLTQRNIKRMSRHYWQHALRCKLIPDSTRFKEWSSQPTMFILERKIQEKLETEVSSLSIDHGVEPIETWMRSNLMATEIQVSDTRQIRFAEYGRKEALFITIMTELFVNAIKHTNAISVQPLKISWVEEADVLVFKCTNPSNRDSRSGLSRGSGRGHSFLKTLIEKLQGRFQPDVYQDLSIVCVEIPYNMLIGERS